MRRNLWLALLTGVILFLVPMYAHAVLVWEETFEAGPCSTYSTCLSTFAGLGWELTDTAQGNQCQITTEQARGGTRSMKMIINNPTFPPEDGLNCNITRFFPSRIHEIYTRTWFRTANFNYSTTNCQSKLWFHSHPADAPSFITETGGCVGELIIVAQHTNENCPGGLGFGVCIYQAAYMSPPGPTVILGDNQWYCIETHIKMNTPGVADGLIELWVDGTRTIFFDNRNFRETGNTQGFDMIQLYRQAGAGTRYWDDFAVDTTRIGCGGAPDTTPPAQPTGLAVN